MVVGLNCTCSSLRVQARQGALRRAGWFTCLCCHGLSVTPLCVIPLPNNGRQDIYMAKKSNNIYLLSLLTIVHYGELYICIFTPVYAYKKNDFRYSLPMSIFMYKCVCLRCVLVRLLVCICMWSQSVCVCVCVLYSRGYVGGCHILSVCVYQYLTLHVTCVRVGFPRYPIFFVLPRSFTASGAHILPTTPTSGLLAQPVVGFIQMEWGRGACASTIQVDRNRL